jgi:cytochrome c-type biogenesis protein CcmE
MTQNAPAHPSQPPNWWRRANKRLVIGVVIVVAAIGVLVGTSLRGALTYYVTVDELKAKGTDAYGDRFRVGGRVKGGSIVRDAGNNLQFVIYHNEPSNSIPVQYRGVVPDIFGDETDVIVEGRYEATGTFHATNLLSQHPPEFKVAQPGTPHAPVKDRDYAK